MRQENRTSGCLYSCVIKSLANRVMPIPILTAIFITPRLDSINSGIL